jgi:5-methylcytosine-specific restriction protein A
LVEPHKVKTAEDMAQKSKDYRVRAKHSGIKKPRSILGGKNFRGEPIRYERER